MSFEVASIRPAASIRSAGFALDAGSHFRFTGGRFSAAFPLIAYITFAYKLTLSPQEQKDALSSIPKWVNTDIFEISARASISNPTKDQLRLMMQSLLAERFRLAVHFDTKVVPAFELVMVKPGKLGPALLRHEQGPPCPEREGSNVAAAGTIFPAVCGVYLVDPNAENMRIGVRNTTMGLFASMIPNLPFGEVSRPLVDRTGLKGAFDITVEWSRRSQSIGSGATILPEVPETTAIEALKEQLGLKLEPAQAPLQVLVIEHVEKPSEN
jgi:uncharacterized protein (TIGR03435 family)